MKRFEIDFEKNNSKENKIYPIRATIYENRKPIAGGIYGKERFEKLVLEKIREISNENDLNLCSENIDALANAIRRIDKTLEEQEMINQTQYVEQETNNDILKNINDLLINLNEKIEILKDEMKIIRGKNGKRK